ncbi:frmB, partial [Symbiodinium microadriaticum]
VSSGEEERVLDPDERVLDLIAFWQRTGGAVEEFRFLYKVGLFYDVDDSDTSAVELMYVQATHDIVDSRYPCSEQDAITLAALQMQESFGDFPASGTCTHLRGKLGLYLSYRLIETTPASELEEQVYKLYKKLSGYSQLEARLSYLDYVKSWKIYGSTYFFAEPQNNKELPRECVLAINNKGILVVDPNTKEFLAEYEYSNVVTWGHSLNSFVV